MDIKPVKSYKTPRYPDRRIVLEDPDILKTLPERWKGRACVGAALSTLLVFSLTACARQSVGGAGEKPAVVAPVFEHGDGRGSFGCVSVAPPTYLSEEEAFQVIKEEGRKYGISFDKTEIELKGVGIPQTTTDFKFDKQGNRVEKLLKTKPGELKLDGYNEKIKVGFEYVSIEDFQNWKSKNNTIYSTVEEYDFKSTAKSLSEGLKDKTGEISMGVFYDPMMFPSHEELNNMMQSGEDWRAELSNKIFSLSKEELRKQVKDFLEWLKAQGIV